MHGQGAGPEAAAARDERAKRQRREHAAYSGGEKDGVVVTGASSNPHGCAKDDIARQLGPDANFTKAFGWRRNQDTGLVGYREIGICVRCQEKYSPSQFPLDVKVDPGGAWGH